MRQKILLLGFVVLGIVLCTSMVSSYSYPSSIYGYNYGAWPQKTSTSYAWRYPYPETPVRIGGFFGANSAYIIGLRPGTYYGTPSIYRPSMYYRANRIGGWFGYIPQYPGYYYGLRPGIYSGYGARYASVPYMYHGPL